MASLEAFRRDPDGLWTFYRRRLSLLADAEPNPAHLALAALGRAGLLQALVTQNVDGLHQAGGWPEPIEVHGSLREAECLRCGRRVPRAEVELLLDDGAAPRAAPAGRRSSRA